MTQRNLPHLGKHDRVVHEGGFWPVYWMSVVIWIVVLFFSSHLVFVTKPAPTRGLTHNFESHHGAKRFDSQQGI